MDLEAYCREFIRRDALAAHLGVELGVDENGLFAALTVGPQHLNGAGTAHGGAIFALADIAFAAACNAGGRVALAVNTHLTFLRATAAGERLVARVQEWGHSRRLGHYLVEIATEAGERVAVFQGTSYAKSQPHPPAGPAA